MSYPVITFATWAELITYINQFIVPNGNNEITGEEHNNVENGLAQLSQKLPRFWDRATVIGSVGNYTANDQQCGLFFKPVATGSITLTDNIWNEWVIVNQTNANKSLVGAINIFTTPSGTISNYVPAHSVINIVKGNDNKWYQILSGTQTVNELPSIIGVCGEGGDNDPIPGTHEFHSDLLEGIASANDYKFIISIDGAEWWNYGNNVNQFTYDPDTNIISFDPDIFTWYAGMAININRNQ